MNMQVVIVLVVILLGVPIIVQGGSFMLKEINDCQNHDEEGDMKSVLKFNTANSNATVTGSIDLTFVINEKIKYGVVAYKKVEDEDNWEKLFAMHGVVCDGLKMIPKLWKRVSEAAKVSPTCPIEEGHYELENFVLTPEEVDLPSNMKGLFKLEAEMFDIDDKSVVCKQFILEGTD